MADSRFRRQVRVLLCTRTPAGTVGLITASLWHTFKRTSALGSDNCVSGQRDMTHSRCSTTDHVQCFSQTHNSECLTAVTSTTFWTNPAMCACHRATGSRHSPVSMSTHAAGHKIQAENQNSTLKTCSRSEVTQRDLSLTNVSSIKIHLTLK